MSKEVHHFIGGEIVTGNSGNFGDIYNPATGDVTGQVALANTTEVEAAIKSASDALPGWAATDRKSVV